MRLPPELCEAIIDLFITDKVEDFQCLINCALVCRFFAVRAQRTIFKDVCLGRPKNKTYPIRSQRHPASSFFSLINGNPRIASYVEGLEISDSAPLAFYREERSWIRGDGILPVILSKLDNMRRFSITGNTDGSRLNFGAWSYTLKHTILSKCQAPLLTRISLSFVRNVPAALLTQAPALETVCLYKAVFIIDAVLSSARPKLKTLEVSMTSSSEWDAFYPWLLDAEHGLDLTGLKTLSLFIDPTVDGEPESIITPIMAIARTVQECASSVEHLTLHYPFEVTSSMMASYTFLDLASLPNLRTLSLQGSLWTEQMPNESPDRFAWLLATLERLPRATKLEHLMLVCSIDHEAGATQLESANWSGLVRALERLATATTVNMLVSMFEMCGWEMFTFVQEQLCGLQARGIARLQMVQEDTDP